MNPHLHIPNPNPNEQTPPSIETFKIAFRNLENRIATRYLEHQASFPAGDPPPLCEYCAAVSERLDEVFRGGGGGGEGLDSGGASSRDAGGNLYLGTLDGVFGRGDCVVCGVIQRLFLRGNRRRVYGTVGVGNRGLDGLGLGEILGLVYRDRDGDGEEEEEEEEEGWIVEACSRNLQVSVGTVVGDGVLSVWWPESTVDEVNDEPVRIPMMAVDHEGVFPGVKPWIPLPREKLGGERDLSLFGTCFESCVQNHVKCREAAAGVGSGFGPGRLIDIEEMRIVRVEIDEMPMYFILSYVWGRPPFLLLEKSNESKSSTPGFLSSQKIPQTISDAIEVTRRFGVRYLWVDALCIVQDDLENKMHEIDRMHMIYAQAQMTIVAATGDGANAGLLNIDPVFLNDTPHLISGKRFTTDAMEMREVVEFSTWFSRGWTFQELVFSRRTLYFTPERTYYACEEGSWSEDFPFDGNVVPGEGANVFFDESLKTGFDLRERLDSFENYGSMVSRMSTRQFTQESDCLNACKGLYTGVLLKGLGGSVCGLPALCFEFALAWQPDGNLSKRQISQNSEHPQFPSWSWAAWNGPIDYPFLSGPEKCGVICDVRWAVFEAYAAPTAGKSHEYRFKQVIPTIKVQTSPEQSYQSMSSWHSYSYAPDPRQLCSESKISALIDVDAEMTSGRIMSNNFIGPSILVFQTRSITCEIKPASRPPLSRHKDLSFFSISNNNIMIGELKIDTATLNSFLDCDPHDDVHFDSDPTTIELISLFEIDFANPAVQDLLWMNANSSRGTFSKAFMTMVQERGNRSMRAVMWITWEEGVASRRAVGYVTVEGFEDAGPVERDVILV